MNRNSKIYIAGHAGMVGSAIMRNLKSKGFSDIIYRSLNELDLKSEMAVEKFFSTEKPEYVFLAAARVGGIQANINHPAEFLIENLQIQNNMIHNSYKYGVEKICFLGSSCIYPRECPQPMKEDYLMTGPLEPTNEGYALAKIAGLRLIQYYNIQYGLKGINPMPCNLYGTNDSFDLAHSHVLSALVKRFTDAKDSGTEELVLWGTGSARREFLHVDDVAEAIVFLMEKFDSTEVINIGTGTDYTIKELAEMISAKIGYNGKILWDTTKPDGMPRKCLDVSKIEKLGFKPKISINEGIDMVIKDYRTKKDNGLV